MNKRLKELLANFGQKKRDLFLMPITRSLAENGWTANKLTRVRLLGSLSLPFLMLALWIFDWTIEKTVGGHINNFLAGMAIMLIFNAYALTDLFDGPLARYLKQTSDSGAVTDALADKLLTTPIEFLAIWVFWTEDYLEIVIPIALIILANMSGTVIRHLDLHLFVIRKHATEWGKFKYAGEIILVNCFLAYFYHPQHWLRLVLGVLFGITAILAIMSATSKIRLRRKAKGPT